MRELSFIAPVVAILHVAAVSFLLGAWNWKYMLVASISGALIWGAIPRFLVLRRSVGLGAGVAVALAIQQTAYWLWRAKLGSASWPLVQFATVHLLIGLSFARMRRRLPTTYVWRGTMVNRRR